MNAGRSEGRRADVQGLRGIAVLAVIAYHVRELAPGGFTGVDVFFVISGYVITRSLLRERAAQGRIGLADFYRRRIHRLAPALFVAVTVTALAGLVLAPWQTATEVPRAAAATFLLSANFFFAGANGYFSEGAGLDPLLHTWSLSLEEQFYLVYPATLIALLAVARRWRALTLRRGMVVALVLSLALSLLLTYLPPFLVFGLGSRRLAFFLMPTRGWQFLAGALLAVRERTGREPAAPATTGRSLVGPSLVGIVLIGVAMVAVDGGVSYPGLAAIAPTLGAALVIAGRPTDAVNRALAWRPLVRAGDISYSWYLWHWPIIVFAEAAGDVPTPVIGLAALASLPVAELSYRLVEDRFRRPGQRTWLTAPRLLVGSALVGLVLLAVLPVARRTVRDGSAALRAYEAAEVRLRASAGCEAVELPAGLDGCTAAGPGDRRVALVGDSNALHFAEGVIAAGRTLGASTTVVASVGCPTMDLEVFDAGARDRGCPRFQRALLAWLPAQDFDVVVVANASDLYLGSDVWSVQRGERDGAEAYVPALHDLLADLVADGTGVVVVHPIPKFSLETQESFGACSAAALLVHPSGCVATMPRDVAVDRRAAGLAAEQAAIEGLDVTTLDVFDDLCPGGTCRSRLHGVWTYSDSRHLSAAAAHDLAGRFAAALVATGRLPPV